MFKQIKSAINTNPHSVAFVNYGCIYLQSVGNEIEQSSRREAYPGFEAVEAAELSAFVYKKPRSESKSNAHNKQIHI